VGRPPEVVKRPQKGVENPLWRRLWSVYVDLPVEKDWEMSGVGDGDGDGGDDGRDNGVGGTDDVDGDGRKLLLLSLSSSFLLGEGVDEKGDLITFSFLLPEFSFLLPVPDEDEFLEGNARRKAVGDPPCDDLLLVVVEAATADCSCCSMSNDVRCEEVRASVVGG